MTVDTVVLYDSNFSFRAVFETGYGILIFIDFRYFAFYFVVDRVSL